jgi:parvulin-like peptidyl-prolyl isomerase
VRQKLNLILIVVALAAAAASGCKEDASAGSTNSGELAAKVGSSEVPLSKVDRVIEQGLQGLGKKIADLSPVELAAARLQAVDTLITEEVLYQRSKQENLQISDEDVRAFIQKLVQQSGLSEDDYQKKLKEAGLTEAEYREENRRKLAIEKLQDKLSAVKSPTDREIEDYFKTNEQQFKVGRGVNLSWIVVDAADNKAKNDAIGNDQAQQKINSIYAQLKGGADFATVARAQSEHESAYRSGDLGFLDEGRLAQAGFPPPLVQNFFGMQEGDITQPVQGSEGRYYIFKLTAKRTQEEQLRSLRR